MPTCSVQWKAMQPGFDKLSPNGSDELSPFALSLSKGITGVIVPGMLAHHADKETLGTREVCCYSSV